MARKENKLKKVFLGFVSFLALAVIGWFLFFGKIKAWEFLSPLIGKVPKDEAKLTQYTEDVLGKAAKAVKGGGFKKAAEKGSDFFESSQYAEPGREIRESVKQRIDELLESIKQLPAKELKIIKMEIYKRWFEEMATQSAVKQDGRSN